MNKKTATKNTRKFVDAHTPKALQKQKKPRVSVKAIAIFGGALAAAYTAFLVVFKNNPKI